MDNEIMQVTERIVDIVEQYLLRRKEGDMFEEKGRSQVVSWVKAFVSQNVAIEFVLPAFPFKAPSRNKVLGKLPDFGEYYSLFRLNALAQTVKSVYAPGAFVTLVSDGSVYHDLVGVSEEDFLDFDNEIRRMGEDEFEFLRFQSMKDLLTEEEYGRWIEDKDAFFESKLVGYDLDTELKTNDNLLHVYRGYLIFMTDDLEQQLERMDISNTKKRKYVSSVAKQLLRRGNVYSSLLHRKFPEHVRLSIHGHNNAGPKFAVAISPENACKTPWHNCVLLRRNGKLDMMKVKDVPEDARVIMKHGRPWLMAEPDADLDNWDVEGEVKWDLTLPYGLTLEFKEGTPLAAIDQEQVRRLALKFGVVVIRGVQPLEKSEEFDRGTASFGNVQSWFFGNVLTVKVNPAVDINNVLSSEAMPMHFDGLFKLDENGKPMAPCFQYFYCKHSSSRTLWANTRMFTDLFAPLRGKKWTVFTPKNDSFGGDPMELDLFEKHPLTNEEVMRFHEQWGQEKTTFKPTHVEIVADDAERWCQRLTDCLYNRKFCLHHVWRDGDMVVADNIGLMHTRPAYDNSSARELWRIHYN